MDRTRRILALAIGSAIALLTVAACSNVIGIQDVHLKSDVKKGSPDEDGGDEDSDTTPPDEENPSSNTHAGQLQVALGSQHTCVKTPAGTVSCWGDDVQGQTGGGALAKDGFVSTPQRVAGIDDAIDIAAGDRHTCVARKSGKVSCWGYNFSGQLGNGESLNRKPAPVDVANITNAFAVAAGGNFSCALRGSGSVACWGDNGSGQLGKGDDLPSLTPVAVPGLTGVVAIAAGLSHACAVKKGGAVVCWGNGQDGQLARAGDSTTPVPVDGVTDAIGVAAGTKWSCVVTGSGAAKCWGANDRGQLGDGSTTSSSAPVAVQSLSDATWISAGVAHTCAARKTGAVVCWGAGDSGQLGDGQPRTAGDAQPTFVIASGVNGAIGASAGGAHSCAATQSQVFCWGSNARGQLGTGDTTSAQTAVTVALP
jgi:alpha-tubulin suppressor-like RCC1 family protein